MAFGINHIKKWYKKLARKPPPPQPQQQQQQQQQQAPPPPPPPVRATSPAELFTARIREILDDGVEPPPAGVTRASLNLRLDIVRYNDGITRARISQNHDA